ERPTWILFSGLVAISLFSTWTGSMIITANIPLLGPELIYLSSLAAKLPRNAPQRVRAAIAALVAAAALWMSYGAWKNSQTLMAWMWRGPAGGSNGMSAYAMRNEPLRGWRCYEAIGAGLDKTLEYLRDHVPPADSLFVLPDATVIYGLSG